MLKHGWVKLKELKREPTEEDLRKQELEAEAKATGKGIWNPHGPQVRVLLLSRSLDRGRSLRTRLG